MNTLQTCFCLEGLFMYCFGIAEQSLIRSGFYLYILYRGLVDNLLKKSL